MPLERLAVLESEMAHIKRMVEERHDALAERMTRVEAMQENVDHKLADIAGILRDSATERRLINKVAHVIGWLLAAGIGWLSAHYSHQPPVH